MKIKHELIVNLINQEIEIHGDNLKGLSGKGDTWEAGFLSGLEHALNAINFLSVVDSPARKWRSQGDPATESFSDRKAVPVMAAPHSLGAHPSGQTNLQ